MHNFSRVRWHGKSPKKYFQTAISTKFGCISLDWFVLLDVRGPQLQQNLRQNRGATCFYLKFQWLQDPLWQFFSCDSWHFLIPDAVLRCACFKRQKILNFKGIPFDFRENFEPFFWMFWCQHCLFKRAPSW